MEHNNIECVQWLKKKKKNFKKFFSYTGIKSINKI